MCSLCRVCSLYRVCSLSRVCRVCRVCNLYRVCSLCSLCRVCRVCNLYRVCSLCRVCRVCRVCNLCSVCRVCTVQSCVQCVLPASSLCLEKLWQNLQVASPAIALQTVTIYNVQPWPMLYNCNYLHWHPATTRCAKRQFFTQTWFQPKILYPKKCVKYNKSSL